MNREMEAALLAGGEVVELGLLDQIIEQSKVARSDAEHQRARDIIGELLKYDEAQLLALKGQYEAERDAILRGLDEEQKRLRVVADQRVEIARLRKADRSGVPVDENGAKKARKGTVR